MRVTPARRSAYKILFEVEHRGGYSTDLLASHADDLEERDRNLSHAIVLGTTRNRIQLDHVIDLFSSKKTGRLDPEILTILRLSVFQLLFLDRVPNHSVINEGVELAKLVRKRSASGFVNAVLRKASTWDGKLDIEDDLLRAAVETSTPIGLLKKWSGEFGRKAAIELAVANNTEPRHSFRLTTAFDSLNSKHRDELLEEFKKDTRTSSSGLVPDSFYTEKVTPRFRELVEEGLIYFQDEASQLVAHIAAHSAGEKLLDLCAAPGSKATLLSRLLGMNSSVIAGEIYFRRARLLRENALRQQAQVGVICLDGRELPFGKDQFETILVDAPCSGTGTIRRNPEIRYRFDPEDLQVHTGKQLSLLREASKCLKDGGTILYSTCSLEREENEDVVHAFLDSNPHFSLKVPGAEPFVVDSEGFIRTDPAALGTDGFFIAVLEYRRG
ncbi:MAG: 16S rRNA (cytosine(967)-C(5))-methyltransferase RsmB [Pyrinomonadaceae bacterium]|nr:16S rRNA (cytosine(967)-C(5))-methyltransferase RsmB [Pyrinomonadaceae bacterium]